MTIRLAFAVTETGPEAAAGDYFTALELGTVLQARLGWHIEYRSKREGSGWYDLTGVDMLVVMVWEYELPAICNSSPHLLTIAWARNSFYFWCDQPWIADYDLHLASSRSATDFMSQRTGKLARLLRIATNPARFNTEVRPICTALDYVFTGHYWQAERDVVDAILALPSHYRGAIYGMHWEQVPALTHLHRGFVPYGQIHEVYRQAVIVIDDSNHVTKEWGAANSRCYDALAAGCLVITNSRSVSDDAFDGRLPVYENPSDLANLLDHYLNDHDERIRLLKELRGTVLARHCYTHRAMELRLHLRLLHKQGIDLIAAKSGSDASLPLLCINEVPKRQLLPSISEHLPSVSFVVPLFNHLAETREMLASLQASLPEKLDYEIVLTDDASTDGTADWLKSLCDPRIKVLISETNRGYAANNNAGVRLARGELLGLLNNDLLFAPGWLEPMLAVLLSPQLKAGLVGNVQYRLADGAVDHVWINLSPQGQFQHIRKLPNKPHVKALAVTGACIILRKSDFETVGGFDETFVNGAEDIDLCYKLRAMGKSIQVATLSIVQHHISLSRKCNTVQDIRNSRYLFSRWGKEIRRDLANVWRHLLSIDPRGYRPYISGELSSELVKSPNILASLIAKMMIVREQAEWSRRLQESPDSVSRPVEVKWWGLSFDTNLGQYVLGEEDEFVVRVNHASNFYICGAVKDVSELQVKIEINVNDIQIVTATLDRRKPVNTGIVGPLILPGMENFFRVRATGPLILTHIVINHQRIDL
jgi:GT2 family glycosyltransferase